MSARPDWLTVPGRQEFCEPFAGGYDHLQAELKWLRLLLHREVLRLKAANLLSADPFRGLYLSDEQIDAILREWNAEQGRPESPAVSELGRQAAVLRGDIDARLQECEAAGMPAPMMRLAEIFGLDPFERQVLIAAAAVEVDLRFESLYSWVRNDVTRKCPSVDLVLRIFCDDPAELPRCRETLRPNGTLFSEHLLRASEDQQERDAPFLNRSLRIDERIADFLLEHDVLDKRLAAFTALSLPSRSWNSLHLPEPLRAQLHRAARMPAGMILYLSGPRGAGKASAVEALCAEMARPLLIADLSQAAAIHADPAGFLPLLERESLLAGADLLLEHAESVIVDPPAIDAVAATLHRWQPRAGIRVFIAGEAPWPGGPRKCAWRSFEFPAPSFHSRVQLWREAIQACGARVDHGVDLEVLANRFALTGGAIRESCADAARGAYIRNAKDGVVNWEDLERAARLQSTHGLRRFAQKVEHTATWDSLIVPPHIMRQLRDVCTAERHRHTVYAKWGFDQRLSAGKGLSVLFSGSSGTGKTMAAGILASELGLDLYRIDLSIVVSKYIGETEKQLSLIFREARTSNAVLFFDEADALFGKRSEVKDAHDRYANVEIAYLLQKMEEYEGIVILATNLRRNIDDAFTRRLQHIIDFPFPDAEHRERIWRSILPPGAPVAADIDFRFLGRQFELAGGNIRNIALAAAFLAADEGKPIRMEHCIVATALELQKTGKLPSRAEFRDHYDLIRSRV
jgi:ATP-dependent 26S proteasome regulatory subunit